MKREKKLPDGHMRARIAITVEGPALEATKSLLDIVKSLPRKQRVQFAREFERKLVALRAMAVRPK